MDATKPGSAPKGTLGVLWDTQRTDTQEHVRGAVQRTNSAVRHIGRQQMQHNGARRHGHTQTVHGACAQSSKLCRCAPMCHQYAA